MLRTTSNTGDIARKLILLILGTALAVTAIAAPSASAKPAKNPPHRIAASLPKLKASKTKTQTTKRASFRATYATQWSAPADCLPGRIQSRPPRFATSYSGGTEELLWSSDLYRYTSAGWQLFDGSKPWLKAVVNAKGILPVFGYNWFAPNGAPQIFFPYNNLAPAWYAVKEFYKFQNGVVRTQWSYFNAYDTNQIYCHMT